MRHETTYDFDAPVHYGLQRLRLTPKTTQGQEIIDWEMSLVGAKIELEYEDQNHNHITLVSVDEGVEEVIVSCEGEVDTADYAGVIGRHAGHLPLWAFSSQTRQTRPGKAMKDLLAQFKTTEARDVAMLHDLSSAIREAVGYTKGTTYATTSAEEAMEAGHGVCQDHAHIFAGLARALDVPTRYVSGYLMMNDRVDQEASHAWAEAHVDGLGWVGFDISNGISPDERYVRVATGRDYREAAPITGRTQGAKDRSLEVKLSVEQQQQ
ncbi:transglutaminase family protein [Pseudoblastomonas halimionae]|uniref:transglutaminase family protein n=1 Tax=Alteriqipengyuania halimionae TaxID=1926630 RepID=UPI002D7EC691|nr:transglutaminase family protein [Alteriqipengyuania halimionae]